MPVARISSNSDKLFLFNTLAWYPERYSYKDGLRSGTKNLLTGFGINLVREFVINW